MPINFHIGASEGDIDWSGKVPYTTWSGDVKLSLGGAAIFLGQLRWMVNLLVSDVPERYPNLNFVSVESGVGWIPFLLDALDYQCGETAPEHLAHLSMKPSEYFRRQFYGCFWFESRTLAPVDRAPRRRSHHVRDRHPPPDLPVPPQRGAGPSRHRRARAGRPEAASSRTTPPSCYKIDL